MESFKNSTTESSQSDLGNFCRQEFKLVSGYISAEFGCFGAETTQDWVQDFFLEKVIARPEVLDKIRQAPNPDAYLRKMVKHFCLDKVRKRKGEVILCNVLDDASNSLKDLSQSPAERIIGLEKTFFIEESISNLPSIQQNVLRLSMKGLSHKEIADQLNISVSTSTTNLNRARKSLKRHLKERGLNL